MRNRFHVNFLVTLGAAFVLSACANMGNTGRDVAPVMSDPIENVAPPTPMMPVAVDRLDPLSQEALNQVMGGMGGATINFAYDRYDVDTAARSTLQAQATWMKTNSVNVIVEGHCDERGTREYNIALGDRRANAVKNYLVAMGVSGSRVRTVSYGKERPVGTDQDANRRGYTRVN